MEIERDERDEDAGEEHAEARETEQAFAASRGTFAVGDGLRGAECIRRGAIAIARMPRRLRSEDASKKDERCFVLHATLRQSFFVDPFRLPR